MNRREFVKTSAKTAAFLATGLSQTVSASSPGLRLGGHILEDYAGPDEWVQIVRNMGYNAAFSPVGPEVSDIEVGLYREAAAKADILISEVMVIANPLHPDEQKRRETFTSLCQHLDLADRIGARCCMAIGGLPNHQRQDPANFSEDTFDMIVETARAVIDEVKPSRAFYVIELLPMAIPDSQESYVRLMNAIDRKMCGAHLDPVNMITSARRYFNNGQLIREFFKVLGPQIKSCHAKDIKMLQGFPVNIQQVLPGEGALDYVTYLHEIARLPVTPGLMIEHLKTTEEYRSTVDYIRSLARRENLAFA